METKKEQVTRSIFLTKKTDEELTAVINSFKENRSRVISRLISDAFRQLQYEESQNKG